MSVILFIVLISIAFSIFRTNQSKADSPPTTISVSLKDFIQSKTDEGLDLIEIEDGSLTAEIGKPVVPYLQKKYLFSKEYSIQSVDMLVREDLKEGTGLKLPVFKFENDQLNHQEKITKAPDAQFYPPQTYTFDIDENEDGTKLLTVTIFPFFYNAQTTDFQYYRKFEFSVLFINSFIHITSFTPEKPIYEPIETPHFDAIIHYEDSKPAYVVAQLTIEDESNHVIASLPIEELTDLPTGEVNVSFNWINNNNITGNLLARLELNDKEGNLLDFKRSSFTVGSSDAKISEFRISKDRIVPKEPIKFYVKMQNTGSIKLSGELIIKITENTTEIKTFSLAFNNIPPMGDFVYEDVWQTTEVTFGKKYFLTAHVLFNSNSSEPAIKYVTLNTPPEASFTLSPPEAFSGTEIKMDASMSYDKDGEIVEYSWMFDDETKGLGKTTTHTFYEPGEYLVRLTVIDNAGDASQIAKKIIIREKTQKIILRLFIGKKTYYIDELEQTMDTEPIILEGRTLLPIRYVAEAIGAKVGWIQSEKKATIDLGTTHIELWIGNSMAMVNGKSVSIDSTNSNVKPIVIPPGRTMLPIRFVAEQLGCLVEWLPETREVKITYSK